jgi:hypothetical protein
VPGSAGLAVIKKVHKKSWEKSEERKTDAVAPDGQAPLPVVAGEKEHVHGKALEKALVTDPTFADPGAKVDSISTPAFEKPIDPKVHAIVSAVQQNAIVTTKAKDPKGPSATPVVAKAASQKKGQAGGVAS